MRDGSHRDERGGIDNNVYSFQICENVYAREQFERPSITKERLKEVDMYTVDRYIRSRDFEPKTVHTRPKGTWGGESWGKTKNKQELTGDGG